jgi:hypothetical protein
MKKQVEVNVEGSQANEGSCVGVHELIDWQIIQYRKEVDAHRVDLSKVEGHCVSWQEAEKDFNASDRASLGDKSRVEYCGAVCEHRNKCLIALHFLQSKKTEPLYRVG